MSDEKKQVPTYPNAWFASDLQFHQLYPPGLHAQAIMHWTPLYIARKAAEFLAAEKNTTILDIGSGAGKFCLAAAYYQPNAFFHGVEQRQELVKCADDARAVTGIQNVSFSNENILQVDFSKYDHFYFFNSFFENINDDYKIDDTIPYSKELYTAYNRYVYKQLTKKPAGTRLVTFHSMEDEIPPGYHEVATTDDELLKCWIKV